ncbi:FAD-binding protein [Hyphomicrobium sp. CS1BSMeth3]|uniref:FAD-binding protein n=1 Tax=Hyphomicrobium sp. CS1BSMeth3 TaxID=1892844 RepID=UPI000930B7DE|nr:FAD-binding protein [Hyphomicrobium sp. CS1BSMeth3]
MKDQVACDVLVAGSGAGAFSAAITARHHGLDVLMVEKEPLFGGTTCYSAGVIWIPGSAQAKAAGIEDGPAKALRYLESIAGNRLDRARAEAFLATGPEMLAFLEANTPVRYGLVPTWADYEPELPGGSNGGRSLAPDVFDGRQLGKRFDQLRPPLESMMLLGGMMVGRTDLPHLYNMLRVPKSAWHALRMFARYGRDRLGWKRGTRLTNGNGLIAALALAAQGKGIPLWLEAPLVSLVHEGGRIAGAIVRRDGRDVEIRARRGVVLACGGFAGDTALKARLYAHVADGRAHQSLPPATNSGDGIRIATGAGAAFHEDVHHAAAWTPVSYLPQPDGTKLPYPHFIDRGKPGYIAVDRRGKRFVNEAKSYHVFVPAMIEACRGDRQTECWNICDHTAIRRWGLGAAPPRPARLTPYLDSGYIISGATPEELAARLGIDPAGLAATIRSYNDGARRGEDSEFGRGTDAYQRFNGAPGHAPNPCVAPLDRPPYYAVRLIPGDIGTFAGLRTDASARVLDKDGQPIAGLYAAGNDMASVMGGTYPGAGITIGPALTFGYIAGRHLVGKD